MFEPFQSLKALDAVKLNFSDGGLLVMNIAIAVIMFGVALEIKITNFKELLQKPKPVIIGTLSQFVLLPAVTGLLTLIFWKAITPGIAMGMILVAACPGGNVSNFLSNYMGGNSALSVSLSAITTIAAVVMTPFNFFLWGEIYVLFGPYGKTELLQEISIDPVQMFYTVGILLGIPIVLGMLVNHYLPRITAKIKAPIRFFSLAFFAGMITVLFANNYEYFTKYIFWILVIVLIQNGLAFFAGYWFAKLSKLSIRNARTISIETGIQNSGLGLVLIFNPKIFPPDLALGGMMFVVAWWGIWHIIAGFTIASIWKRKPVEQE
ncbi:MAG: bile acid:sodium symporter family protein [Prevotellaceae bacterium]|jgi:BASS family bile acid:Na+ symporter|nr:bile acid:sodium symporter family protein [Prevotellaceae bacterium]